MLISILVPIYKVEKFIQKCVISLFEQTYSNIEYVFVDDCSPDGSIDLLKKIVLKYPNKKNNIKIIHHKENKGLAEARNTALKNATGEYIIHIDSDDYIEYNTVELLYKKAVETGADIVVSDYYEVFPNKKEVTFYKMNDDKFEYLSSLLLRKTPVCIWGKLIRRNLYINNNILSIPRLNYGEDYVVIPRLVYFANKVVKVPFPLYNYLQLNQFSYSNSLSKTSIANAIKANNILIDFFKSQNNFKLPLDESKAINLVSLLYASPKEFYPIIYTEAKKIKLNKLQVSLFYKSIILIAKLEHVTLLNVYISIVNFLRRIS